MKKINVALVGLGFGGAFVDIYKHHPNVESINVYDPNIEHMNYMANALGVETYPSFEAILADPAVDAVHLVSPIPAHEEQTVQVLEAGKHCACTVPMATSLEGIKRITEATRKSGKKYMMMETTLYTYQFHYVKHMLESGELGRIQFMRGSHYQDMENWPSYWLGLPPMHYATHAVAPLLCLADTRATEVHCYGSGVMREELTKQYGNPYPAETAIFRLEKEDIAAEVSRTLFHTVRSYVESFNIYGEKMSFEWYLEDEKPYIFTCEETPDAQRGRSIGYEQVNAPDRQDLLPKEIAHHTQERLVFDANNPHLSVVQGGNHHGSHPHMVHEFVRSIVENRKPMIDAVTAANWTAAGICAHESAMQGGAAVQIPAFD